MRQKPNQLWWLTSVLATWAGFVLRRLYIDCVSRRNDVGCRAARSMTAKLTLDALELALWARKVVKGGLIHHSARQPIPCDSL